MNYYNSHSTLFLFCKSYSGLPPFFYLLQTASNGFILLYKKLPIPLTSAFCPRHHELDNFLPQTARTFSHILVPRNDFVLVKKGFPRTVLKLPNISFGGFFSSGFSIWKEHNNVSSTLIKTPALSNSPQ